jgi:CDP-diacylglycerol--glycerol-3-phosphate 3-phosphatidyltransferase
MILAAVIIIGREIAISALREWMAVLGHRAKVAVSALGKYKTILQMVGLSLLLYRHDMLGLPMYAMGQWLTLLAALLTLVSMFLYLRAALPYMRHQP